MKTKHQEKRRVNKNRGGLTLVEILIALTMTLIVLGAMAQAFKFASGEIAEGRSILELANRLRNAEQLLRRDLAGLTVEVRPHTENTPDGYFEYVEGPNIDGSALGSVNAYLGDPDDMLAFTSRSLEGEFRGRFSGQVLQSTLAEIVWFTDLADNDSDNVIDFNESLALYRRVLLVRPDLNSAINDGAGGTVNGLFVEATQDGVTSRLVNNDISVRVTTLPSGSFLISANSLTELGRRENRFARNSGTYPHRLDRAILANTKMGAANGFSGDDILLTDLAGFDIQIYSPNSKVDLVDVNADGTADILLNPSDAGYVGNFAAAPQTVRTGGFVDLAVENIAFNYADADFSQFTTFPEPRSLLRTNFNPAMPALGFDHAFCTWSPHYETDGIDQDGDGVSDEGRNGLDDDGVNGVDDDGELETSPPYPFAPRGIKATFRVIEKNTKQVRQTSVIHNFSKM